MLHAVIGLCCIGAACLVGAATESKSHRKAHKTAQARRLANGFKPATRFKAAKIGACYSCAGGAAVGASDPTSVVIGAQSFATDLPWLPDDIAVAATRLSHEGLTGDDLVVETLREVYPVDNYYDEIAWPVARRSPLALLQERTRRHIASLRLGR